MSKIKVSLRIFFSKQFFLSSTLSEPSTRGILTAYSNLNSTIGMFFIYALNIFLPWRTVALICLSVPMLAMISLCLVSFTIFAHFAHEFIRIGPFFPNSRFPKRRIGSYPKIAKPKPRTRSAGFVDGRHLKQSLKSSPRCSSTLNARNRVIRVSNRMWNVHTRSQHYVKNLPN